MGKSDGKIRWENKKEEKQDFREKDMEQVAQFSLAEVAQFGLALKSKTYPGVKSVG